MIRNGRNATLSMPSDRELLITRAFPAPRQHVFEAWTQPEHVRRWYSKTPLVVCEIDLRVGGRWRYVLREPDGSDHRLEQLLPAVLPRCNAPHGRGSVR